MPGEYGTDNLSLHADPPAVNNSNLAKPTLYGLIQVFLDNDSDFSRLKGMEINRVLDRDFVHIARI